jgi:hypothetical protein
VATPHPREEDSNVKGTGEILVRKGRVIIKTAHQGNGPKKMADQKTPKRNPTVPVLPEEPITLSDALRPLFEPPIPDMAEFLEERWATADPESPEGQVKMLWLRYKQTAIALAVACKEILTLEDRVARLEHKNTIH